ncbi:protein mono-ADP-ribosyltransferase PARP14 [Patella vulgata]|uniref:protein mono-ADP-ribosyltransferase PARP14 n=1 Tax=Patella vulgata TaxID=6465 RepID=UPI00218060D2|nr:protein mono-ADP-ribosyltransferase PARP14 [Patella vulgata]XP_050406447.1 protein mono-ADP-ribosyltransferase PARP14 [Patella vulgata]XP_050406448.1 protein mono-ADP-ribosyltransferase PARP14 [Patella vulgata]XP_055957180.1 protein mono-ADP-ribosyltransferase PARP14 [Patella vulgata]
MAAAETETNTSDNCVLLEGELKDIPLHKFGLYFENKSKSRGGPLRKDPVILKHGILVEFESSEAVQGVIEKGTHTIGKNQYKALKYQKIPHYLNKILVRNIPEKADTDDLQNFLEALLSDQPVEVETVRYCEDPKDAVVSFKDDIDIPKLKDFSTTKTFLGTKISIQSIEMTNVVKLVGINPEASDQTLKLYFQNTRRSGGGRVNNIERLNDVILIYFADYKVVDRVCRQFHHVNEQELKAELYLECLGIDGGSTDPNFCEIPNSLIIDSSSFSTKVINILLETPKLLDQMNCGVLKDLMARAAEVGKTKMAIHCTSKGDTAESRTRLKTWSKDVERCVKNFIENNIVEKTFPLTTKTKETILTWLDTKLSETSSSPGLWFTYTFDESRVLVTGVKDAVSPLIDQLQTFVNEEQARLKYEASLKKRCIDLKPHELLYLKHTGNLDKIREQFQSIDLDIDDNSLRMKCTDTEMNMIERTVKENLSDLVRIPLQLTKDKNTILGDTQNHAWFYAEINKRLTNIKGIWLRENGEIVVWCKSKTEFLGIKKVLETSIIQHTVQIPEDKKLVLQSKTWSDALKRTVEEEHLAEAIVTVSNETVFITAMKHIIDEVLNTVTNHIDSSKLFTETVPNLTDKMKDSFRNEGVDFSDIEAKFHVRLRWQDDGSLTISGTDTKYIETALGYINGIIQQHKKKTMYFKEPGVEKLIAEVYRQGHLHGKGTVVELTGLDPSDRGNFKLTFSMDIKGTLTKLNIGVGSPQFLHADVVLIPVTINDRKLQPIGTGGKIGITEGPGTEHIIKHGAPHPTEGETVNTEPGNFYSRALFYGVYPTVASTNKELCMGAILEDVLKNADEKGFFTVALPVIKSNSQNLDKSVNQLTYSVLEKYLTDKQTSSVRSVWMFADTDDSATKFKEVAEKANAQSTKQIRRRFMSRTRAKGNEGTVTSKTRMSLVTADIAWEETEAVVNSTNGRLDLSQGAIAGALRKRGGDELQADCKKKYPKGIQLGEIAKTLAFNMKFTKYIYHCNLPEYQKDESMKVLKETILKCLQQAEKDGIVSIAFPAIGAGILKYPREEVANNLFEIVHEYGENNPTTTLTDVVFVMFKDDQNVIKVFKETQEKYKKKYGTDRLLLPLTENNADQSERLLPLSIYSKVSAVLVSVYAIGEEQLREICDKCQTNINRDIKEKTSWNDDILQKYDDDQMNEVISAFEQCDAEIEAIFDRNSGTTKFKGLAGDIMAVKSIYDQHHIDQRQFFDKAQTLQLTHQWVFIENSDLGKTRKPYDTLCNYKIEMAYTNGENDLRIKDSTGKEYKIDFIDMVEKADECIPILRTTPYQDMKCEPPNEWGQLTRNLTLESLDARKNDYQRIAKMFIDGLGVASPPQIVRIDLVKNIGVYQRYMAMKNQMVSENGGKQVDRQLFHGTNLEATTGINRDGFNRSYCSNESAHGQGVYFTADSSYAVRDNYSRRDKDGQKYVYLADVLVGNYQLGREESQRVLPQGVHSVVDSLDNPRTFVIFTDNQAYPKYLIVFK